MCFVSVDSEAVVIVILPLRAFPGCRSGGDRGPRDVAADSSLRCVRVRSMMRFSSSRGRQVANQPGR